MAKENVSMWRRPERHARSECDPVPRQPLASQRRATYVKRTSVRYIETMDRPTAYRLLAFGFAMVLACWAQRRWPAVPLPIGRLRIQGVNLLLGLVGALAVRLLALLFAVGVLTKISPIFPGLFGWVRSGLTASPFIDGVLALLGIVALDLAIYLQHRVMHHEPWLWRWHAVHHSDGHLDGTTAIRFHPIELCLSWAWKMSVALALGISPTTVMVFEMTLSTLAIFNHAGFILRESAEQRFAAWLITPAVHRMHHEIGVAAVAGNYGFSVPWWDRLFGTYRARPFTDQRRIPIGLLGAVSTATTGIYSLLFIKQSVT